MANSFKELNTLNIKRPAVVMVKKPFATDNEMSNELRDLLFKYVPQERKQIKNIVGTGKYKAVYFQELIPGIPYILDNYTNVPYFDSVKTSYGLNLDPIISSPVDNKNYFLQVCSSEGGNGDMALSNTLFAKTANLSKWLNITTDQGPIFRTYKCWIFDSAYYIPQPKKTGTDGILNENIIASVNQTKYNAVGLNDKLSDTKFGKTKIGQSLLKNNLVYSEYTIVVQEGVGHMKKMTMSDLNKYIESRSDLKDASKLDTEIRNQDYWLHTKYEPAFKDIIDHYGNTVGVRYYYIKNLLLENMKNLIGEDFPNESKYFAKESGTTIFFNNGFNNGTTNPALYFGKNVYFYEIIDAYIYFCKQYRAQKFGTGESYEETQDFLKRCIPAQLIGIDTSSSVTEKTSYQLTYGTYSPVTIEKLGTGKYTIIPGSALAYLVQSFSLCSTGNKSSETKITSGYEKSGWKDIPTVVDFKFELYKNVFKKYIYPRYLKIKSCPGVIVRQCQDNFVSDLISLGIQKSEKLSDISKFRIINLCDKTLFNLYTGFYISNETYNNETISEYVNTEIYPEYLSKDIESALKSSGISIEQVKEVSNRDVSSVIVSRQVMGKSVCSIILKNDNRKYNIDKDTELFGGDIIFEPMDEVFVYFPSTEGKLLLSFKGYLSEVESAVLNGYHSIVLSGACTIKKLEMVRTNIRPSLSDEENSNTEIHPFIVPESFFQSFEKWGLFMFAQAVTFFHSMLPSPKENEGQSVGQKICTINNGRPDFYDSLLTYLWYKSSNNIEDQSRSAGALEQLLNEYVVSNIHTNGTPLSEVEKKEGIQDLFRSYNMVSKEGILRTYNVEYDMYAQRVRGYDRDNGTGSVVAQVLGTRQPAFMLGVKDINIIFSDYRTNLSILLDTAEKFNFFLYSNKEGVVQFRPPQIDLSSLSMRDGALSKNVMSGKVDLSYLVDPNIISEQITASYQSSMSDATLINWLPLKGSNEFGVGEEGSVSCVIENRPLAIKYGIKSQKEASITGISDPDALFIYGLSLMDRNNKSFRSAKALTLGYGDMDVNSSVYSPTDNVVYLREGLVLKYESGNTFTAESSLNWGRKPLFKLPKSVNSYPKSSASIGSVVSNLTTLDLSSVSPLKLPEADKVDIKTVLEKLLVLFENGEITVAYFNQLKVLLEYIKVNNSAESLLSSFIFNGYVWDGVSSISFEDLMQVSFDSGLPSFAGFELAIGTASKKISSIERLKELQLQYRSGIISYMYNTTGIYVTTIFTDSKNKVKMIFVNKRHL